MPVYRLNPQKFKEHYLDIELESKHTQSPEEATLLLSFLFNAIDINDLSKIDLGDGYLDAKALDAALKRLIDKDVLTLVPEGVREERPQQAIASSLNLIRLLYELSHDFAAFGPDFDQQFLTELQGMEKLLSRMHLNFVNRRQQYLTAQLDKLKPLPQELKLHFGVPGLRRLEGWINMEPYPGEVACSMKWKLPFADNSVKWIFSAHTIEHLFYKAEALDFLKEARRVLKDDGMIRIITPDAELMGQAYAQHDDALINFRQGLKHYSFTAMYRSRLEHILRYSGGGVRPWEPFVHKYAYDFETLEKLLLEAGFKSARKCAFMTSPHGALRIDDQCSAAQQNYEGRYFSLFAEAGK